MKNEEHLREYRQGHYSENRDAYLARARQQRARQKVA